MGNQVDCNRTTFAADDGGAVVIGRVEAHAVELREIHDAKSFRLDAASANSESLTNALSAASAGRLDGEYAWIDPDFVRSQAQPDAGPDFSQNFASMLDYARTEGFVAPGGFVRAHIEWH